MATVTRNFQRKDSRTITFDNRNLILRATHFLRSEFEAHKGYNKMILAKHDIQLHRFLCLVLLACVSAFYHESSPFLSTQQRQSPIPNSLHTSIAITLSHKRQSQLNQVSVTVAAENDKGKGRSSSKTWFPTRIQEDVNYADVVKSLYVRHILVETAGMAKLAMDQYLSTESMLSSPDSFGHVAKALSACPYTRDDGGAIGWIDISSLQGTNAMIPILPINVMEQLVAMAPKSGDAYIIPSTTTNQFHVVRVEELHLHHLSDSNESPRLKIVGSHFGTNKILPRRKLKGRGVVPEFPLLTEVTDSKKTYSIQTSGCQMNVADSERLAGILEQEMNLVPSTKTDETPDVVIFNTCSIRDHAEQKLYDALGPYCAKKRQGEKNVALIVTFLKNVLESVEWGHQVVATAPMLHQEDSTSTGPSSSTLTTKPIRGHSVRAWVNVIHGCNEHCTYCVVPATRGMEQSRTMENILQECSDLVANGYKEVTLLGQNIDAYGRDMVPKRTFAELLEYLNTHLPDGIRIRYVTSHPRYFSDRVIDAVANLDKVCECFHMPFQAGDDDVLKRMRRGYTFDSYMNIVDKIRAKAPDASICGDVIVGFPGETEEAFERTLELMKRVKFDNLNTFAYSPRPNTEAALWNDLQICETVKKARLHRVQDLAAAHGLERSQRYLGRTVEVLVEDKNPRNSSQIMGRTRQGRQVYFDGDLEEDLGKLVQVRITEARTWSLVGELVTED